MAHLECNGIHMMSCGILSSDERAEVLNLINHALEEANFNLEIGSYEDLNVTTFDISFIKKDRQKGLHL